MLRGLRRFHDIALGFLLSDHETAGPIAIGRFLGHAQG
jgi:hypothetical protein